MLHQCLRLGRRLVLLFCRASESMIFFFFLRDFIFKKTLFEKTINWKSINWILLHFSRGYLYVKGEPELTDPFNLLINVKLRML